MKRYIVSLDVVTDPEMVALDVTAVLGIKASEFVCQKGDGENSWIYEVGDDSMSLMQRIDQITKAINIKKPVLFDDDIKAIYLNIGVFYDTMDCTVDFLGQCIVDLCQKIPGLEVEITTYPVDNDVDDADD